MNKLFAKFLCYCIFGVFVALANWNYAAVPTYAQLPVHEHISINAPLPLDHRHILYDSVVADMANKEAQSDITYLVYRSVMIP